MKRKSFMIFQIRRGIKIAIWEVPADSFERAVFDIKQTEEHRDGDKYEQMVGPAPELNRKHANGE